MPRGNLHKGLLSRILKVITDEGESKAISANAITEKLKLQGEWDNSTAKTPERTISSYLTQNPEIFEKIAPGHYRLRKEHRKALSTPHTNTTQKVQSCHSTSKVVIEKTPSNNDGKFTPEPQNPEHAKTKTSTELTLAPKTYFNRFSIEGNQIQAANPTEISDFAEELLKGNSHHKAFDALELNELSSNVRLLHSYQHSGVRNVSEFLAKGRERMKLRNHGKGSEKILYEAVLTYITEQPINLLQKQTSLPPPVSVDHSSILDQLKRPCRANDVISGRIWKLMTEELGSSEFAEQLIAPTAAEIDMAWPFSRKSSFSDRIVRDFLRYSLSELQNIDRFGKKRVRTYAACVVYLHKLLTDGGLPEDSSLKQTIVRLWQNSRLKDREKKVLHLRFGIQDERKHTLAEIKDYFSITRERVRQIEKKAIAKLRMSRHFEALPGLVLKNKEKIWEQLTTDSKLKKREWMESLEDQLGFEYQLALELIDYRKHRNPGASALSDWLDTHFHHDETYWYEVEPSPLSDLQNRDKVSTELLEFIDQL